MFDVYQRYCFMCHAPLRGKRWHIACYCSKACKQRAYRLQKKDGCGAGQLPHVIPPKRKYRRREAAESLPVVTKGNE